MALTPYQRRLIELGLASPEEFGLEESAVAELPIERFLVSPVAPEPVSVEQTTPSEVSVGRGVVNAAQRGVRNLPERVSNIENTAEIAAVRSAQDERGLLERIASEVAADPLNPLNAAFDAAGDYVTSRGSRAGDKLRQSLGMKGYDELEQEATRDLVQNIADISETNELFPQSARATRFGQSDAGLADTLRREGGIGDAAAAVLESAAESLISSAPAIAGTIATRGRGAATILGADAAAQEYSTGIMSYLADTYPDVDPRDYDKLLEDPDVFRAAEDYARTRATIVGLGAGASARVAGALLPDRGATAGQFARNVLATQPVAQGAMDFGTEATAQLATKGELDSKELFLETAGGMVTAPADVAGQVLGRLDEQKQAQEATVRRRAMVDEAKTLIAQDKLRQQQELQEFAQRNETVAQAFQQGTLKQADLFDGLLNEELAPSVGGAREIEQAQRLEQEATDQVEARRVRNTVDEVDRAITQEALDRPDNIMAQALFSANRSGDIANAVRPATPAATEVAPQPESEQLALGFRDPEVERIEKLRKQTQAQQKREAAKSTPLQKVDESKEKDRAAFQKDYLTVNPNASTEEVLQRTQVWSNARDSLESLRNSDTTLQAAEVSVSEQLAKLEENRRKSIQRKEKNAFDQTVRDMAGRGVADVTQIARAAQSAINQVREASGITTAAPQTAPTPSTAPATRAPVSGPVAPPSGENAPSGSLSYEETIKRLGDTPEVTRAVTRVVPEKSATAEDAEIGEFDVEQIEEADVREQARANPNLRRFLSGTVVRPIMYHVTRAGADIRNWRAARNQVGPHLSADTSVGEKAARGDAGGKKTLRMAVNIKNPVRLQDFGNWGVEDVGPQLVKMGKITEAQLDEARAKTETITTEYESLDFSNPATEDRMLGLEEQENQVVRDLIRAAGHDGVVYFNRFEIPGVSDNEKASRLKARGKSSDFGMSDAEFKAAFPEADTSVMAIDSNQVKDVDNNSGEYGEVADIQAAVAEDQSAKQGMVTLGEIQEAYGEDVANLMEDYRAAKGPQQRVTALLDYLELSAVGREHTIIRALLPLLRKHQSLVRDVVIAADKATVKTSGGVDSLGYYNPNNAGLRFGMRGLNPTIVAHELVHGVTWARLRDKEAVSQDKDLAAAVVQVDQIRASFQEWVDANKGKHKGKLLDLLAPKKGGLVDADGKVDTDELITYGLTDKDIQSVLRGLPARGTLSNQWRKFVNAVRLSLGLDSSDANLSALESLLEATTTIVGGITSDRRADVLEQYTPSIVEDTAEQAKKASLAAAIPVAATRGRGESVGAPAPETAAAATPKPRLTRIGIADRLSISTNALTRGQEVMTGRRRYVEGAAPSLRVGLVDSLLPVGGQVEAIRQAIEARRGNEVALEYGLVNETAQESVIAKYSEEAATIMRPGISQREYAAAEAKIRDSNPELFQAIVTVRESIKRNSLRIIKGLYEASPKVDGVYKPNAATQRQIDAIAANLDNYWTTVYQVHNKDERAQWQQIVRTTEDGAKILKNATSYLKNDLTSFEVADLAGMGRSRLERIAAAWLGEYDLADMKKPDIVAKLTAHFGKSPLGFHENAEAVVAQAVRDLLQESGAKSGLTKYFSQNRVAGGVLKERLEVPEPVAKLMGRIDEPLTVLYNTELAQGLLLEQLRFAQALKEDYTGIYFFNNQEEALAAGIVDAEELRGASMGALNGMFTSPEVQQMFAPVPAEQEEQGSLREWVTSILPAYSGVFKITNLLLNPALMFFNGVGSLSMALANGVGPTYMTKLGPALLGTTVANLQALSTGKYNQQTYDMYRNMLADTPIAEAMRRRPMEQAVAHLRSAGALAEAPAMEKLGRGLSDTHSRMWTLYSGVDLAAKLVVYYKQLDVLTKVNDALPADLRMTEEQVSQRAAARTRQTTFSYELAAKLVRDLDRTGIFVFATYQYETFRSLFMSSYRILDDLRLADDLAAEGHVDAAQVLRNHSAGRFIGVGMAMNNTALANAVAASALVGVAELLGYGLSDEEEEERERLEEAYKNTNKFAINKDVRVLGKVGDEYLVMDVGRITDPYGPVTELRGALLAGDLERIGAATAALVSLNPLLRDTARLVAGNAPIPTAIRNDPEALAAYTSAGLDTNFTNFASRSALTAMGMLQPGVVELAKASPLLRDVEVPEEAVALEHPLFTAISTNVLKVRRFDPLEGVDRLDTSDLRSARRSTSEAIRLAATVDKDMLREMYLDVYAKENEVLQAYVSLANAASVAGRSNLEVAEALKKTSLTVPQQRYVLSPLARNYSSSVLSESTLTALESAELRAADTKERRREIVTKYREIRKNLGEIKKEIP